LRSDAGSILGRGLASDAPTTRITPPFASAFANQLLVTAWDAVEPDGEIVCALA